MTRPPSGSEGSSGEADPLHGRTDVKRPVLALGSAFLVFGALWFAQTVLVPIVLAILLAFLLGPLADRLQRWHFGRVFSPLLVIVLFLMSIGGLSWLVLHQGLRLAEELPNYQQNIVARIEQLRSVGKGPISERAKQSIEGIVAELGKSAPPTASHPDAIPVAVTNDHAFLPALPTLFAEIGRIVLFCALLAFILLQRRELRDRLIRIIGSSHLTLTTKALDEAGDRIGSYLRAQSLVNFVCGAAIAGGLWLLGIDYALLWGLLAFALRFIPYVGVWIAALLPLLIGLAQSPDWSLALRVIGLFSVIELIANVVLEPIWVARGIGISQVALLIAAAFWTWLWGPVGLLLAAPMTVCILVLSKYVPELGFLHTMLADDPVIPASTRYYQRLLAKDADEAKQIVDTELKEEGGAEGIHDALLVPAVNAMTRDAGREEIDEGDVAFAFETIAATLDSLEARRAKQREARAADEPPAPEMTHEEVRQLVLGVPVVGRGDGLMLRMVQQVVADIREIEFRIAGDELLLSEILAMVEELDPGIVFVASCPPDGVARIRSVVLRLRMRFPSLKILVGRFGAGPRGERDAPALIEAGADRVLDSIGAAKSQLSELAHLQPAPA